jgi:formylmethanofuran dehydrogenase subunit C
MTGADATSTWTNAANSTLNYGGTNLLATGTLNASATDNLVHYNGGSGQNIKEGQYYKLSFSGTGSKTLPLGTVSILNDFTNNATMVAAGTVNFNGTSSILGATPPNFNNLTVSGALTSSSGTINVAGAFTNNGTFNHNNGTVNFNGTAASIAGSSITFNNLSVSSGTLTPSPISFNVIGDFTNDAIFSGNGSTVVFTGSNAHILGSAVPDFHNLTISGTLTSSSGTINIAGNFTDNGTFNHNNGTVRFNGAASNILGSSPLSTFYKLTVGASSSANIGKSADLLNELNVEANGTFDAGTSPTNIFSLKSTSDDLAADASIGKLLNGAQVIGNVRVERYMSGEGRIYRYLSSPVQNAKVSDWMDDFPITGNFTDPTVPMTSPYFWPSLICGESILSHRTSLWFYNEPSPGDDDAGYRGYPLPNNSSTTSTLQVGRGYVAFIRECDDPTIVDVRGPINSGTINLPVTFTKHSGANGIGDGWNLVGNPYPAPILWDAATGWSKNRISQSIAIRDNSINNGGNFFKYYDGTDPDDFNGVIAQGQGFWIRTQEGTGSVLLQINENAKANGNAHSFYRQAISQNVKNSVPSIVISMEKNGLVDKAYIRQRTNSIMELDEWDAPKLKNELFGIATVNPEGIPMAINAVPLISDGFKIPIHIADSIDSPATIAFSKQNGFEEYAVELTDKLDGVKKILQWNEPYNFMSIGSNPKNINRFEARLISSQNSPKETFTLTAYPNPVKDELTLVVPDETGKYKIDIFDNRGIKLPDLETRRESQMLKINFSLTSPGLYLIRVTRDSHISWTKVIKE